MTDHRSEYKEKVFKKEFDEFVSTQRDYLHRAKVRLLASPALTFRDGTVLTPERIWSWLFEKEAPEKYPNIFVGIENYDLESPGIVKFLYLYYSFYDRLVAAAEKGVKVINRKETIPDLFYGLGAIPIRGGATAALRHTVRSIAPGNHEACGAGSTWANADYKTPFNFQVVPTGVACYDTPNNALAVHRAGKANIPIFYLDNPIGSSDKPWAIDYRVQILRRAAVEIARHTGRKVEDEAIRKEIIVGNKIRKALWRIFELQAQSEQPPFTAYEFETVMHSGHNWAGEPEAYLQVIREIAEDVPNRVNHRVHGTSRGKDPVRIFVGGACTHFRPLVGPASGAVPVGVEWFLVPSYGIVSEEGDPFRALADGSPLKSLTQPLEQHADWIVDHIRLSRAEGFIYGYKFGCNFGSSAANTIADIVREKAGIPTLVMETDMIGKKGSESGGGLTRVEAFIELLKTKKKGVRRKRERIAV